MTELTKSAYTRSEVAALLAEHSGVDNLIGEVIERLPRDLRMASATLGVEEVRFLVDTYYRFQDERKAGKNQSRALDESEKPHETITFFADQFFTIEKQIKGALDSYSEQDPLGVWARANFGIGPVIAAGLLAHIDISKVQTAAQVWSFAGQDPNAVWGKGQKRPWNARLKNLCWKIGDSFVKNCNKQECYYGHVYKERKRKEIQRDLKGYNKEAAAQVLKTKNIQEPLTRAKYESGHLPDAHIHARAQRYATKLFLAHYFEEGYRQLHNTQPPLPYPIAYLDHTHVIPSPV